MPRIRCRTSWACALPSLSGGLVLCVKPRRNRVPARPRAIWAPAACLTSPPPPLTWRRTVSNPECRRETVLYWNPHLLPDGRPGNPAPLLGPPSGAAPLARGDRGPCRRSRPVPPSVSGLGSLGTQAYLLRGVAGCPRALCPAGAPSSDTSPDDLGTRPCDHVLLEADPRAYFMAPSKGR